MDTASHKHVYSRTGSRWRKALWYEHPGIVGEIVLTGVIILTIAAAVITWLVFKGS